MVMASHMAAEEARAAWHLGEPGRRQCPLFIADYLRFDVYGGSEGDPACLYWNHEDIGLRLTQGSHASAEAERMGETYPDLQSTRFEIVTTGTGENAPLTSWSLGASRPGTPEQFAMTLEHPLQP